jgi:hypothetical protein
VPDARICPRYPFQRTAKNASVTGVYRSQEIHIVLESYSNSECNQTPVRLTMDKRRIINKLQKNWTKSKFEDMVAASGSTVELCSLATKQATERLESITVLQRDERNHGSSALKMARQTPLSNEK